MQNRYSNHIPPIVNPLGILLHAHQKCKWMQGGIDIIGDKSYYRQILLSNTTRLHCKQWQLRISPESIVFPSRYMQLLSLHSIFLFYCTFTRKQNCTLEKYIRRGTTLIVKKNQNKKKKWCNGNPVYVSSAARELEHNIPFYKSLETWMSGSSDTGKMWLNVAFFFPFFYHTGSLFVPGPA